MHRSIQISAFAVVALLVLASGIVSGVLQNRWATPNELGDAAEQLSDVPEECGQWRLLSEAEIDPEIVELLACAGYVNRSYQHLASRETVHVAITVGPPGRIAVHTPDICFTTQGYNVDQPPVRRVVDVPGSVSSEFTFTSFVPDVPGPEGLSKLIAYHAFSDGGPWQSPNYPRIAFGGRAYLMKLQLAGLVGAAADNSLPDPCRDFLEAFLPAFEQARDHRRLP